MFKEALGSYRRSKIDPLFHIPTKTSRLLLFNLLLRIGLKINGIACDVKNIRSRKIPERLGFVLEGIMKFNRVGVDGVVSDTLVFVKYGV